MFYLAHKHATQLMTGISYEWGSTLLTEPQMISFFPRYYYVVLTR